MPRLIAAPTVIAAAGNKPKSIEEFVGRANTGTAAVSIARMRSPAGWAEPGQSPAFDEYTLVLAGLLRVTSRSGVLDVRAGQAIHASPGEWVQYSTPEPGGAEYVAVCVPAFAPDAVHRDAHAESPRVTERHTVIPLDEVAGRFTRNTAIIRQLVACPEEQARWKPDARRWSLLEVLNHLLDEEREDFRQRIDILLHDPERPWPPINPDGWVVQRAYNATDPAETLAAFLAERRASLEWLAALRSPDWSRGRVHLAPGELRAGDLLAAWQRHDLLHVRQLVNLHAEHEKARAQPFRTDYAGS